MLESRNTAFLLAAPFLATALWRISGKLLRNYFVKRYTVLNDLPNVGKARPDGERIRGTAVICGGSISGLWAARICADHFEDVLIVEPEPWLATPDGGAPVYDEKGERVESTTPHTRTRLYQYNGSHLFQIFSFNALRHVFPTFDEELRNRDGRITDADCNVHTCAGPFFRPPRIWYPKGDVPQMFFCSRDAFERLLRSFVIGYSKRIRCIAGIATGVKAEGGDARRIESVTVNRIEGGSLEIPATMVVDCSGGTQIGLKWTKKMHAIALGETKDDDDEEPSTKVASAWNDVVVSYNINSRWRTYIFFVPPHIRDNLPIPGGYDRAAWLYSFIPMPGVEKKNFVIDRIEGHRIRYSFYGWGNPPVPEDFDDIREYLSTLNAVEPVPEWIRILTDILIENRGENTLISGSKLPPMNWIKYEQAPFLPSNFIATGDAVMRVNPSFGQGCTKACIGAVTLDSVLRSSSLLHRRDIPKDFSSRFFKVQRDKLIDAWDGTKPMDYMFDTTTPIKGEKLSDEHLKGSVALMLLDMSVTDLEIDALLVHVRHFLAPATDLFAPWVLWRLTSFALRRKLGFI